MNLENIQNYEAEDVLMFLKQLERRRQKITVTGRLSEEQDMELTEIDNEVNFWNYVLDKLLFEPEDDAAQ